MRKLSSTFRNFFRRKKVERDLDAEVRGYAGMLEEENRNRGMNPIAARREANMSIGGIEQVKEDVRGARAGTRLESLWQDLRFAFRALSKSPAFASIAILTIALGIAANVAVFTLANRLLLRPLPYSHPDQLVWLNEQTAAGDSTGIAWLNFRDWQRMNQSFSQMAGFRDAKFPLALSETPQLVSCRLVTANYFDLIGASPLLGRVFDSAEDVPSGPNLAILSFEYWRDQFAAAPDILGKSLRLNQKQFTIIGVLPASVSAVSHTQIWLPFESIVPRGYLGSRNSAWLLYGVARRKPGVSLDQARADMVRVGDALARQYPADDSDSHPVTKDLTRYMLGDNREVLILLIAAVGFLLLITCANLATLLLVKTAPRSREFSVRMALGAGRNRILRQIFTEGILLSATGGILGATAAAFALRLGAAFLPSDLPFAAPLGLDARGIAVALALTALTCFVVSIAPALAAARASVQDALRASSRVVGGRQRTQRALIVCEVALVLAVLVGTGLLVRTMKSLLSTDLGFNSSNLLAATVSLPTADYPDVAHQAAVIQQGIERIRSLPGVVSAAAVFPVPFTQQVYQVQLGIEGRVASPGVEQQSYVSVISPGYLSTMNIRMIAGRDFTEDDLQTKVRPVVIDRGLASRYWPNQDPIGRSVKLFTQDFADPKFPAYTIVGVCASIHAASLTEDPTPRVYVLISDLSYGRTFVVRTTLPPVAIARSVQDEIHALNRGITVSAVGPLETSILDSQKPRLQAMWLLMAFSAAGLLLAAIGLYGVMSHLVGQRTNEIGVRMALGARPGDVFTLILGNGAALVTGGTFAGLALALALGRMMRSLLFDVRPADSLTLAASTGIILAVAWLACYVPARRAMKVDPMVALRHE